MYCEGNIMLDILGIENKFEKYAEVAANKYLNDAVPLNDAIIKIAKDKELNPEQIKRVVEAANVKVFQKHFSDADRDGHKDVDFDVADPKVIIKKIYVVKGAPSCPLKEMKEEMGEDKKGFGMGKALDFFKNLGTDSMFSSHKEDSFKELDMPSEDIMGDRPTIIIRIRKAKSNLEKKAYILSEDYSDLMKEVTKPFRATGNHQEEFNSFCKEAYATSGNDVKEQLDIVAKNIKLEVPTLTGIPMNKVANYLNSKESTIPNSNMEKLAALHSDYYRTERAIKLADEAYAEVTK